VRLIGSDEPLPRQHSDGMVLAHSADIEIRSRFHRNRYAENTKVVNVNSLDVVDFYRTITQLGVGLWIDGGWGVDALLGEQTRQHENLDIAIEMKDVPALRHLLQERGYTDIKLEDARPWNFVLGDENGREIDVHVIVLDDRGDGIYGRQKKGRSVRLHH
jgi:hypothetical protein